MMTNSSFQDRFAEIRNKWFLMEPAYFMVLCTHKVEFTDSLKCGVAVGKGTVFINEEYFNDKSDRFVEESLKAEMLRILLKHPYQRQLPNRIRMFMASNFVLANNTKFHDYKLTTTFEFFKNREYDRASLEEIYDVLKIDDPQGTGGKSQKSNKDKSNSSNSNGSGDNKEQSGDNTTMSYDAGGNGKPIKQKLQNFDDGCNSSSDAMEKTKFWQEDEYRQVEVNNVISKIDSTANGWGNIPGDIVDAIKKSIEPKFNYKAIFQQFRSTVLSSTRTLTRMKPNRRFGYDAMGSKRNFTTKILVAVDTSGSISDEDLQLALGFINKFFKYGISQIDCIQFDTKIYPNSLKVLSKKMDVFKITGRGGTDFNEVFEYTQKTSPIYDGVIILTDGYASVPHRKYLSDNYRNVKYVWCLNNEQNWKHFKDNEGFKKFGKSTFVDRKYNE